MPSVITYKFTINDTAASLLRAIQRFCKQQTLLEDVLEARGFNRERPATARQRRIAYCQKYILIGDEGTLEDADYPFHEALEELVDSCEASHTIYGPSVYAVIHLAMDADAADVLQAQFDRSKSRKIRRQNPVDFASMVHASAAATCTEGVELLEELFTEALTRRYPQIEEAARSQFRGEIVRPDSAELPRQLAEPERGVPDRPDASATVDDWLYYKFEMLRFGVDIKITEIAKHLNKKPDTLSKAKERLLARLKGQYNLEYFNPFDE